MKFRSLLLLCAAVLLTGASVRADRAPYPGSSVKTTGTSSLEVNAQLNRGLSAELTPGVDLVESSDANSAFTPGDSKALPLLDPLSASSSEANTHHAILTPLAYDGVVAASSDGISWNERQQRLAHWREQHDGGSTSVPEPGSLPLVLIGLAALGFVALRRGALPIAR